MKLTEEEKKAKVEPFRPIDDVFFEALAQNPKVCQEILRVILEDDKLIVDEVITQCSEKNIYGRSVRLDALCTLGTGEKCNIEIQRSDNDDHLRRARFNASSITVKSSEVGSKFKDVVDVCIVYISQFDIFKQGRTIYHVDKVIRETGTVVDDGLKEVFVNTAVNDGSTISELMSCFLAKDVDNPKFPMLSSEVKRLKNTEGGLDSMCDLIEKYNQEAVDEKIIPAVKRLAKAGTSVKDLAEAFDKSTDEIEAILNSSETEN